MAETLITKDDRTPIWTAGITAERGNYTERSHLNMKEKEKDMRGSAIPHETEMTGNVFLWWP